MSAPVADRSNAIVNEVAQTVWFALRHCFRTINKNLVPNESDTITEEFLRNTISKNESTSEFVKEEFQPYMLGSNCKTETRDAWSRLVVVGHLPSLDIKLMNSAISLKGIKNKNDIIDDVKLNDKQKESLKLRQSVWKFICDDK